MSINLAYMSMLRKAQLIPVIIVLMTLQPIQAFAERVIINDINKALSKQDKKKIKKVVAEELRFHRLHFDLPSEITLNLRLFPEYADYRAYQQSISNTTTTNGFYYLPKKELVVNRNRFYLNTIYHEAQHLLIHLNITFSPRWLNEGLSEFFETAYLDYGRGRSKKQIRFHRDVSQWLEAGQLPALQEYFSMSNAKWIQQDVQPNFKSRAISWSLIYFFMSSPKRKKTLSEIIKGAQKGSPGPVQIINRRYRSGIKGFEKDWHRFIKSSPNKQIIK